jgi:hypothetical protein
VGIPPSIRTVAVPHREENPDPHFADTKSFNSIFFSLSQFFFNLFGKYFAAPVAPAPPARSAT